MSLGLQQLTLTTLGNPARTDSKEQWSLKVQEAVEVDTANRAIQNANNLILNQIAGALGSLTVAAAWNNSASYQFPDQRIGSDGVLYTSKSLTPTSGHDPVSDSSHTYWAVANGGVYASLAQLIAGTIDYLGITPKGIADMWADLGSFAPAGMILQSVYAKSSTVTTTTSTSWQTKSDCAPSLVTKKTNSKIRVTVSTFTTTGAGSVYLDLRREVTGGTNTDNISGKISGIGAGSLATPSFQYVDEPGQVKGTTITYKINYKVDSGQTGGPGHANYMTVINLEEIA